MHLTSRYLAWRLCVTGVAKAFLQDRYCLFFILVFIVIVVVIVSRFHCHCHYHYHYCGQSLSLSLSLLLSFSLSLSFHCSLYCHMSLFVLMFVYMLYRHSLERSEYIMLEVAEQSQNQQLIENQVAFLYGCVNSWVSFLFSDVFCLCLEYHFACHFCPSSMFSIMSVCVPNFALPCLEAL